MGLGKKRNKRHLNRKSISVIYSTKYLRKNVAAIGYTDLMCRVDWECAGWETGGQDSSLDHHEQAPTPRSPFPHLRNWSS